MPYTSSYAEKCGCGVSGHRWQILTPSGRNLTYYRIDLSVASRVHLLEPGWNPMLEQQALDRVHRLGQTCQVIITCYYVAGPNSVEEVILTTSIFLPSHF